MVGLLSGVGDRTETQATQGIVLLLPDLFGSFLFQFAAGALELGWVGWGQTPSNAYFSGGWRLRRGRCGTGKCRNDLGNKHILTCGLI